MIANYLISKNNEKIGYIKEENNYYYEKITKDIQYYSVTWRGNSNQILNNNRLIKLLFNNGIRYKASSFISKSPDDCGLPCYYTRIQFYTDRNYLHDKNNHKGISWEELENIINSVKNINGNFV